MTQWHLKSRKRVTGGHRNSKNRCTKKLAWRGGDPADTKVGEEDVRKKASTRGKTTKVFAEEALEVRATVIGPVVVSFVVLGVELVATQQQKGKGKRAYSEIC